MRAKAPARAGVMATALASTITADERANPHVGATVNVLAEAERLAGPLLLRRMMDISSDPSIQETVRDIADKVFTSSAAMEDAITDVLEAATPDDACAQCNERDLYNGYYSRTHELIQAAYCLGLAIGGRIGGAR